MLGSPELISAKKNDRARKAGLALLLYLAVAALWIVLVSLGLAPRILATEHAAAFAFVPPFTLLATIGHLTGKAPGRGGFADRAREPALFWIVVSFYWLCAAGMLVLGLRFLFGVPA